MSLELITERHGIESVADRWKQQYCKSGVWQKTMSGATEVVYDRLRSLRVAEATPADVAAIIGNDSWVGTPCTECDRRGTVVRVGEEPDYESATVYLCHSCISALASFAVTQME